MVLKTLAILNFCPQVARLPVLGKKVFAPVMIDVFYEKHVGGLFFGQSRHFFQNKDWQFLQGS